MTKRHNRVKQWQHHTLVNNDDDDDNDNNKEEEVINNITTNNTTNIELEQLNSTEVLPARDTHYQEYSFGITTIILQTNNQNESIKASNWINGMNKSIGTKRIWEIDWTGTLIKGRNVTGYNDVGIGNRRREGEDLLFIIMLYLIKYYTHVVPINRQWL